MNSFNQSIAQIQNLNQAPRADTARSLLESARAQFALLEEEIGKLSDHLEPLREMAPTTMGNGSTAPLSEPSVLQDIRGLVERISRQRQIIQAITGELRL